MSKEQRISFAAVAAVIAVVAVIVLAPGGDDPEPRQAAVTETQTPAATPEVGADPVETPTATPTAKPKPKIPMLRSGKERTITVNKGDTVRFAALSKDADEEVHVHGYDISKEAPAGKTIRMNFEADIEGVFEVEFERSAEPIARLKVEP